MTATRISLHLWILSACTGATAAPPPGQPSPAQGPAWVTPAATSLEQTESQLKEEIARRDHRPAHRRFVTAYYVNDRTAADLLTDLFRRRKEVSAVRLHEGLSRTHARGAGNRDAGRVYLAEETWWELEVESEAKELRPRDVAAWIGLLEGVPADTRWRLGPTIVAGH
jgi:hypothetical protein